MLCSLNILTDYLSDSFFNLAFLRTRQAKIMFGTSIIHYFIMIHKRLTLLVSILYNRRWIDWNIFFVDAQKSSLTSPRVGYSQILFVHVYDMRKLRIVGYFIFSSIAHTSVTINMNFIKYYLIDIHTQVITILHI